MTRFTRPDRARHRPVAISLSEPTIAHLDALAKTHGTRGRSGIVQEALRRFFTEEPARAAPETLAKALLVVCFQSHDATRVNAVAQPYADLVQSMMHTHVGGHECVQVFLVAGTGKKIADFESAVSTLRDVHFVRRIGLPVHDASEHGLRLGQATTGSPK